jgi:hypothetical protein
MKPVQIEADIRRKEIRMKRAAMIAMILVLVTSAASARKIAFGAKAGIYSSNMTGIPTGWSNTSFRNAFADGVYSDDGR